MASSRGASLNTLLNSLEVANKKDCYDFSHGHLNENKLLKVGGAAVARSWVNAKKPQISLTPRSRMMSSVYGGFDGSMREALLEFSIGTNGTIPVPPAGRRPEKLRWATRRPSKDSAALRLKPTYLEDGVLIEEFRMAESKSTPEIKEGEQFLPIYATAVTKRDQYVKLQTYENDVLRKQDTREQNVLSGFRAVEHLEHRLQEGLDLLRYPGHGPNFHRLQVYSDVFSDLVAESTLFGPTLKTIKEEYDHYMAHLLDNNPQQHQLLQDQVEQLTSRRTQKSEHFLDERMQLASLEREAERLLMENERLRSEIEKGKRREIAAVKSEPHLSISAEKKDGIGSPAVDLVGQVERLRVSILEKLDEMQTIRADLNENYMPISIVSQLEHCVKETEIENQKIMRKNELQQSSVDTLVQSLHEEVQTADTPEKDATRIWRRVLPRDGNKSAKSQDTVPSTTVLHSTGNSASIDSDSESEDDETKWSWYIS